MVLTAKELDVMIALVEVKVQITATFRAFQIAGKHAGLLGDLGPLAACPLGKGLYLLLSSAYRFRSSACGRFLTAILLALRRM